LGFSLVRFSSSQQPWPNGCFHTRRSSACAWANELHAPLTFESDQTKRLIEQIERIDNPHLGLIPDCGIFARFRPEAACRRSTCPWRCASNHQPGARLWQAKVLLNDALPKLKEMGLAERNIDVIEIFWGSAGQSDPGLLVTFAGV